MSQDFPVAANERFAIAAATAGQTAFTIPFPWLSDDDIAIERLRADGTRLTLTRATHYTLAGRGNPTGGSYTLKPAHAARTGDLYTVHGAAVLTRESSVVQGGRFNSALTDRDFDRLTLIAQELRRDIGRALKMPYGASAPEVAIGAAGTVPKWDAAGNLVEGPAAAALEAVEVALAVEAGRALVHGAGAADPYDALGRRLAGVGAGADPGDAVTKAQLDAVVGEIDPAGLLARVTALETSMAEAFVPGDIKLTSRKYAADPAGWLLLTTTRTIGAAGSGANVADGKTEACYLAVWADYDNSDCPIFDSAGVATTRGASAAADYAAGKRLTLPTPAGRFPRLASEGKATGLKEDNQNKAHAHAASFAGQALPAHTHSFPTADDSGQSGGTMVSDHTGGAQRTKTTSATGAGTPAGTVTVNSSGGEEARPDSFVFTGLIKL